MVLSIRKNIKYKKVHKKSKAVYSGVDYSKGSNTLCYGFYGLRLTESGVLTFKQLEAARRCITRVANRKCKIWFRVYPDRPSTFKSKGSRMGKGVGKVGAWFFDAKRGRIVFEVSFLSFKTAKKALLLASKKLPLLSVFVAKVRKKEKIYDYEINRYL